LEKKPGKCFSGNGDRKRNRDSAFLEKETGKETVKVGFGKGDRKRNRESAFLEKETGKEAVKERFGKRRLKKETGKNGFDN
jgi:hypothetical protein